MLATSTAGLGDGLNAGWHRDVPSGRGSCGATARCCRPFKQQSCQRQARLVPFRQAVRIARSFHEPARCAWSGGADLSEAPETSWQACPKSRTARAIVTHVSGTDRNRLAGAPGFEPGNGGIKIRCLTTWLRPKTRADHTGDGGTGQRLGGWTRRTMGPRSPAPRAQTARNEDAARGARRNDFNRLADTLRIAAAATTAGRVDRSSMRPDAAATEAGYRRRRGGIG